MQKTRNSFYFGAIIKNIKGLCIIGVAVLALILIAILASIPTKNLSLNRA